MPTSPSTDVEATLASATGPARAADEALVAGVRLGRYVLGEVLGQGGMGTVYAAHDPDLDRRVAIKVLHVGVGAQDETSGPQRLLREAQAMAKLSHPNVVAVHDVGVVGTRLYLAMELIEGSDLRTWLGAQRRGWRAIVEVFAAAGAGLAAAHDAGIIHRDFKPKPSHLPPKAPLPRNAVDLQQSGLLRGRRYAQEWSGVVRMAQSWPKVALDLVTSWRVELGAGWPARGLPSPVHPLACSGAGKHELKASRRALWRARDAPDGMPPHPCGPSRCRIVATSSARRGRSACTAASKSSRRPRRPNASTRSCAYWLGDTLPSTSSLHSAGSNVAPPAGASRQP